MHRVLSLLFDTKRKPEYRAANQILYRNDAPVRCVIEALSPSSASQKRVPFFSLAPRLNEPTGSIPNPGPKRAFGCNSPDLWGYGGIARR